MILEKLGVSEELALTAEVVPELGTTLELLVG